ncbi:DNA-binding response regulator, OmpR family, contains REC and winged-helix (wHTH) domain [Amycolatopsis xylanica]|uniref:DNA-binding response regulator, OmpR family, contains REC and winged-helix (WHTH) domain n=1 Tax=Amycolatopsis xylanica TaxID=589385 RepID=A0A1H3CTB0_9PSEU|nr:two-component system response regulator CseB [Amycolatopsis xylanica]SDX57290.1 DNA-binding response regulator, OmpR family, contains REC and winged-helix (wHTH) domain [Amycolatopsis xylanica]
MSERSPRVLLVEDDDVIRVATQLALRRHGLDVRVAADGLAGLAAFHEERPDVALLDVMLPELDGVSLCRRIREAGQVPVLMISARGDAVDVVNALEAGADDYVIKPFETTVLVARIRAVMRRAAPAPEADPVRVFGDLTVDPAALEVRRDGRRLELTPTELRLLLEFAAEPGVVLSRDTLLDRVWDYQYGGDTRVVDVHVQRLRNKIGKDRLETVRGFGYKLRR